MDKPECVINPKSGRVVKTSGKLGQKMLQEQQIAETTPHTIQRHACMYVCIRIHM